MTDLSDTDSSGLSAGWTLVNSHGDLEVGGSDSTGSSIEVLEPGSDPEDKDPEPEGHPQQAASLSSSPECIELQQLTTHADGAAAECTPQTGQLMDSGTAQPASVSVSEEASFAPDLSTVHQFFNLFSASENASGADKPRRGFSTPGEKETSPRMAMTPYHPHFQSPPHTASHTDQATHTLGHLHSDKTNLTHSRSDKAEASHTNTDEAAGTMHSVYADEKSTDRACTKEAGHQHKQQDSSSCRAEEASSTDRGSQTESSSPEPLSRSRRMSLTSLWSVSSQSSNVSSSSSNDDDDDDDDDGDDDSDDTDSVSGSGDSDNNVSDVTSATSSAGDDADQGERRSSCDADCDSEFDCLEAETASTLQSAGAVEGSGSRSQVTPSGPRSSGGSWCRFLAGGDDATQLLSPGCGQSSDAPQTAQESQEVQQQQQVQPHSVDSESEDAQPPDEADPWNWVVAGEADSWNWVVPAGEDEATLVVSSSSSTSTSLAQRPEHQPQQTDREMLLSIISQIQHTATEADGANDATQAAATRPEGHRRHRRRRHHPSDCSMWRVMFCWLLPTLLMVMVAFFLGFRYRLGLYRSNYSHDLTKCQVDSQYMQQQMKKERQQHEQRTAMMQSSLDKLQKENLLLHKTLTTTTTTTIHRSPSTTAQGKEQQQEREATLRHLYYSMRDEREMGMNATGFLHYLTRSLNVSAFWTLLHDSWGTTTTNMTSTWSRSLNSVSSALSSSLTRLKKGVAETKSVVVKHVSSSLSYAYRTVGSSLSHLWSNSADNHVRCGPKHPEDLMVDEEDEYACTMGDEEEADEDELYDDEEDDPGTGRYRNLHKDNNDRGRRKFRDHQKRKYRKGKLFSRWSHTMKKSLRKMQKKFCQLGGSFQNWFATSLSGSFSKLSMWREHAERWYYRNYGKQQEQKDSRAFHKASPDHDTEQENHDVEVDEMFDKVWHGKNGWTTSRAFYKATTVHDTDEEIIDGDDEKENEQAETFEEKNSRNRHQKKWSGIVNKFLKKTQKVVSRFGDKLQNTWQKVKATSWPLWSESSVLGRMATKVKDSIDRLSARLQKKADQWHRKQRAKGDKHSGKQDDKKYDKTSHTEENTNMFQKHASAGNGNYRKYSDDPYQEPGKPTPNEEDETKENEPLSVISRDKGDILNRPDSAGKAKVTSESRGKHGVKRKTSDKASSEEHSKQSDNHDTERKKEKSKNERKKPDDGYKNLEKKEKKGKNKKWKSKNRNEKDREKRELRQSKKFENKKSNKKRRIEKQLQFGEVDGSERERRSEKLKISKKDRSDPQHKPTKKKENKHSKKEETGEKQQKQERETGGEKKNKQHRQSQKQGTEGNKTEREQNRQAGKDSSASRHNHPESQSKSQFQSQGRTRFQLLSQFQALFSKVNSMGLEDFKGHSYRELRAMEDEVESMEDHYNAGLHQLGLPLSGSGWLGCQRNFWEAAATAAFRSIDEGLHYRLRVTQGCVLYMASWQFRVLHVLEATVSDCGEDDGGSFVEWSFLEDEAAPARRTYQEEEEGRSKPHSSEEEEENYEFEDLEVHF